MCRAIDDNHKGGRAGLSRFENFGEVQSFRKFPCNVVPSNVTWVTFGARRFGPNIFIGAHGRLTRHRVPEGSPLAYVESFISPNQNSMLIFGTYAKINDLCYRQDLDETFILVGQPGSVLSNWLVVGEGLVGVPAIQASLLRVHTNIPVSVSNPVLIGPTMYNVAIYMESYADGADDATLVASINWINVQGNSQDLTLTLLGPTDNIQQENLVILAAQGTDLVVSTAFSGAPFYYDICCNILILPTAGA
jgi:hypothetical protein